MLRHADGDADGKDDRQVAEDDVAGAAHDGEQRVQERAVAEGAFQAVGLNGRRVREGRADAEEQTGNRQDGDRQHEASADGLQHAENLVFHTDSSLE